MGVSYGIRASVRVTRPCTPDTARSSDYACPEHVMALETAGDGGLDRGGVTARRPRGSGAPAGGPRSRQGSQSRRYT